MRILVENKYYKYLKGVYEFTKRKNCAKIIKTNNMGLI